MAARARGRRRLLRRPRPGADRVKAAAELDGDGGTPARPTPATTRRAAVGLALLRHRAAQDRVRRRPATRSPRYFPLEPVLDGMLDLTGDVFGARLPAARRRPGVAPGRARATTSSTAATGSRSPSPYMDLLPREGKFSHAAAFDLVRRARRAPTARTSTPVSAIVANFTKPDGRPTRRCCATTRSSRSSTSSATSSTRP